VIEMNEDVANGSLKQLSGKIKQKWAKLTDDDLRRAEGDMQYLYSKLQHYYGLARDKAEERLKELGYQLEGGSSDRSSPAERGSKAHR
jgi:uncharacterized protein YjbJ (UPF0337 family)